MYASNFFACLNAAAAAVVVVVVVVVLCCVVLCCVVLCRVVLCCVVLCCVVEMHISKQTSRKKLNFRTTLCYNTFFVVKNIFFFFYKYLSYNDCLKETPFD